MKLLFVLFIALCYADDSSSSGEPKETAKGCSTSEYYDRITKKCKTIPTNCKNETGAVDPFYGCLKCTEVNGIKYYAFKGDCIKSTCKEFENEVGCTKCDDTAKRYVMVENKYFDGTVEYTCVDVKSEEAGNGEKTEEQILFESTAKLCETWGEQGCTKCIIDAETKQFGVLVGGFCIENKQCSEVKDGKCSKCASVDADTGNPKHYYLNDQKLCVPCDENCKECEMDTGNCKACKDGFVGYYNDTKSKPTRKCYECDPHCAVGACLMDISTKFNIKCKKCKDGYFNVKEERCVRCPDGCSDKGKCEDGKGCVDCDDPKKHFLIPNDYLSDQGGFHFNFSDVRIGWCIPHQEECPLVNRSINGCAGCNNGYVLDKVTYKHNGQDYWTGFCSGASQLMILYLIGLLLFFAF